MGAYSKKEKVYLEDVPGLMVELIAQMKEMNDKIDSMLCSMTANHVRKDDRELLTTMEVANMLKVARITVYRMANRGDIPCYRNGKNLLFYKDEITEWVENSKTNGHLLSIPTVDDYFNSRL